MSKQETEGAAFSRKHSVTARLWMSMFTVIGVLIGISAFSAFRMSTLQERSDKLDKAMDAKVEAARRWSGLIAANTVRVKTAAGSADPAVDGLFKEEIPSAVAEINTVQKTLEAMDLTVDDRQLLDRIATERKSVQQYMAEARLQKASDQAGAAKTMSERFNPAAVTYVKSVEEFADLQAKTKARAMQALAVERHQMGMTAAGMMALVFVALIAGAFWLVRSIQAPLAEAMKVANRIAQGDLTVHASVARKDEFGSLLSSMSRMADQLRAVVGEVRNGIESVSTASSEIATGNQDLSVRTEQAASNLQETASAMEQLTATVGQSADTAGQVAKLARSAVDAASKGGEVVGRVVQSMTQISDSSRRISDIIGTIDGIAFQTNILALNAAVEAARAGEQGRGFAVVAAEVRALAQRSAGAAKEIKSLIGTSADHVEAGSALVEESGAAMRAIMVSVKKVTDLIGDVATAADEQRDGIAQVNTAVAQLDQMTQQNAALVEESAAAAQSLREQSRRLAEVVSVFRVNSDGQPA